MKQTTNSQLKDPNDMNWHPQFSTQENLEKRTKGMPGGRQACRNSIIWYVWHQKVMLYGNMEQVKYIDNSKSCREKLLWC